MQQAEAQQLPSGCGAGSGGTAHAQQDAAEQCFNVLVDECVDAPLQSVKAASFVYSFMNVLQ